MITWSNAKKPEYKKPGEPQEFLRRLGNVMQEIHTAKFKNQALTDLAKCQVAVFKELHADLTPHLHAIIRFPKRTTLGSYIGEFLLKNSIGADARVRRDQHGSGSAKACDRFLSYCMMVSEEKWLVDTSPILVNMTIPPKIADNAKRSYERMRRKPANLDSLHSFLAMRPNVTTPQELDAYIDRERQREDVHEYHHLPYTRLKLLVSKLGKSFTDEFYCQLNRVRAQVINPGTPFATYYRDASSSACSCAKPALMFGLLKSGLEFHDAKEYYGPSQPFGSSRAHLGSYYRCLVDDNFPSRQQSLCIVGTMGSGKSVVASQHLDIYPKNGPCDFWAAFVFKPALDDSFPFTGISSLAKFIDLNDFRTSLAGFSPSTLLNLGEHVNTKAPQKSGSPVELRARLVITANYFEAKGKWRQDDVDALIGPDGRCSGGPIVWKHPLPKQQSCPNCRKCASAFMQWCIDGAAPTPAPPVANRDRFPAANSKQGEAMFAPKPQSPAQATRNDFVSDWDPFSEELQQSFDIDGN